jgi:hypothetical protein
MRLNRVGIFLPLPEDENRSIFRKVVFTNYLEFWTIGKVHEPSDPEFIRRRQNPLNST